MIYKIRMCAISTQLSNCNLEKGTINLYLFLSLHLISDVGELKLRVKVQKCFFTFVRFPYNIINNDMKRIIEKKIIIDNNL